MMTIKNGKFFKDGVQVPLQFGNKEQIAILKLIDGFKEGIWSPFGKIKCICGDILSYANIDIGTRIKCNSCDIKYTVIELDDFKMLKMIPKKA